MSEGGRECGRWEGEAPCHCSLFSFFAFVPLPVAVHTLRILAFMCSAGALVFVMLAIRWLFSVVGGGLADGCDSNELCIAER